MMKLFHLIKLVPILCLVVSCGGSDDSKDDEIGVSSCTYTLDITSPNAPSNIRSMYRGVLCTDNKNLCLNKLSDTASQLGFSLSNLTDYSTKISIGTSCSEQVAEYIEVQTETFQMQAGCHLSNYVGIPNSQFGCGLLQTTGDYLLDYRIGEEAGIQNYWFNLGVPANVFLFDECMGNKNALSNPAHFILMGQNLLLEILTGFGTEIPYAAVMGHEFAHQVQFEYGWINQNLPTVRNSELEADIHAAYYLLYNKYSVLAIQDIEAFLINTYNIGDYAFNSPGHHGTPTERFNASVFGMALASASLNQNVILTNIQVHDYAIDYIARGLPSNISETLAAEFMGKGKTDLYNIYIEHRTGFEELMDSQNRNYVVQVSKNR